MGQGRAGYLLEQVLADTRARQDSRGIKLQLRELALAFPEARPRQHLASAAQQEAHMVVGAVRAYESARVVVVDGLGVAKRLEHDVDVQHTGLHGRLLLAIQEGQVSAGFVSHDADAREATSVCARSTSHAPAASGTDLQMSFMLSVLPAPLSPLVGSSQRVNAIPSAPGHPDGQGCSAALA